MKLHYFKTAEVNPIGGQIYQIKLQPQADSVFQFTAGQYLQLVMAEDKQIPLSIASPSDQQNFIELHLKVMNGHPLASEMLDYLTSTENIVIKGPFGSCTLTNNDSPAILIAGGTGLSPMKSIVETALGQSCQREISLYFGAQKTDEMYQNELFNQLSSEHNNFSYVPVLGAEDAAWQGEQGFPHKVAIDQLGDEIEAAEFYISGSPQMVLAVYQDLLAAGANKQSIHSDILDLKRAAGEID